MITTGKKKGFTQIIAQPDLHATFVKKYIWAQWDPQQSLLYYIVQHKDTTNGATTTTSSPLNTFSNKTSLTVTECHLRCVSFADLQKPVIVFVYPVQVRRIRIIVTF